MFGHRFGMAEGKIGNQVIMPTYGYKSEDGEYMELIMSIAEMENRQRLDGTIEHEGKTWKRTFAILGVTGTESNPGWPIESQALGIPPEHIERFRQFDRSRGVPTDYTKTGEPILRDRNHRRRYLKAHNCYDRNGGYGD